MHRAGSDLNLSEPCKLKASEEGLSVVQSGGPWACRVSESYTEGAACLTQVVRIQGEVISCWPQLGPSGTIPSQWQLWPLLPASLLFARVKTRLDSRQAVPLQGHLPGCLKAAWWSLTVLRCLHYSRKHTFQPRPCDLSTGARSGPRLVCSPSTGWERAGV